ncbi:MAG: hypothetical protein WKG07_29300 [Hymenobacter sp.]
MLGLAPLAGRGPVRDVQSAGGGGHGRSATTTTWPASTKASCT